MHSTETAKGGKHEPAVGKYTSVSKNVPTCILSVTLQILTDFHSFCTAGKHMKFATNPYDYPPHLRCVATLPREIKNSNFWPPVNCACVSQRFNSLLTPRFVQHFSGYSSVNLFAVYPSKHKLFIKILSSSLNTKLIVDKHYSQCIF